MKNRLLGLTAVLSLLFAQTTLAQNIPSYVTKDGLVGWWPFNGNANDESGNGNNGTVNGATLTSDRFGISGRAYFFNGVDNLISIPNSNSLNITGKQISISLWINSNNDLNDDKYKGISKGGYLAGSGYEFIFRNGGDNGTMQFTAGGPGYYAYGTTNYNINAESSKWFHTAAVLNNGKISIYINGVLYSEYAVGFSSLLSNNSPLLIGTRDPANNLIGYLKGKLDDIAIWNRALSEQEIKNLYNGNICFQNVSVTDTLFINSTITSFNPITYENTIKIYPNPSQGQLTIDFGNINTLSGYQMKVINPVGQQIFQSNITQRISTIALSSFSAKGVYFVQLINGKGEVRENRKIVIR
ncbi:MAG: T9SS type A sorting domain-containing protein [Bacteroidetes bacterium]|nr:T9SS type A sorting domain-containing protein [Bacteroidota bacterium]